MRSVKKGKIKSHSNYRRFQLELRSPRSAGSFLGYTKESCIVELLSTAVLESLEDEHYLGFNRRGGIIQMKDSWLLFVNFGGGKKMQKFTQKFTGRCRFMTFSIDPRKDLDGIFYHYVSVGYHGQDAPIVSISSEQTLSAQPGSKLILFARPDSGSQYLICGECNCVGEEACKGGIDLLLEVKNFEDLENTAYTTMVGHQD